MNKEESSDSVEEEQEDEIESESQLEQSFMNLCVGEKEKGSETLYNMEMPKSKELMFILFSFYQDDLSTIGLDCSCKVRLSLNKIKIASEISQNNVDACRQKLQTYLEKLSYTELNHDSKYRILYSPYFKEKAELLGFRLCKFNDLVYCHSNRMSQKVLIDTMKGLFSGKYIFTVDIKTKRSKEREIYNYFRDFIKKMKDYNAEEFKSREVVVQLDNTDTKINCIGTKQRDLMAVKNTLRNLLESTAILIVKFETPDEIDKKVQEIKAFVKSKSKFPITIAKVQKRAMTIITKENVLRKLIQLPKMIQFLKLKDKTELGMFLPRRNNFIQRKIMIEEICTKKGYDFTTLGGIYHYFKKMFIHQDEEIDPKEVLTIIHDILEAIKENKQRFDVPDQIKDRSNERKQVQVTEGEYYSSGQVTQDIEISNILKRNVLKEKLKMSKPCLVKYRICDAPESDRFYWYLDAQKNKVKCEIKDMKQGSQYFYGKVKKLGPDQNYFIESKIIIT